MEHFYLRSLLKAFAKADEDYNKLIELVCLFFFFRQILSNHPKKKNTRKIPAMGVCYVYAVFMTMSSKKKKKKKKRSAEFKISIDLRGVVRLQYEYWI